MTQYADPQRCPDCRGPIQYGAQACPTCDLPLAGPIAGKLFSTLTEADDLLRALRASQASVVPAADVDTPDPETARVRPGSRVMHGLSAASVPKILLGLGAVCLLVAAMVFLAVTWSVMGVAGRTATLVGFTVIAGVLASWLARRGLRAGAESFALVALGLLAFDLFGARDSGWFSDITTPGFLVLLGAVLVTAGVAASLAVRRTPVGVLTGAEVVAALGTGVGCIGIVEGDWFASSAAVTAAVVLAAAAAVIGERIRLAVFAAGAAAVSGCAWLLLLASSLERAADHPTGRELWLDLEVWPLVVAAGLMGSVALVSRIPVRFRVAGLAAAELVMVAAILVPFAQGTGTELTLAVLVVLAFAGALTWLSPRPWAYASAATATVGAGWMAVVGFLLTISALSRIAETAARLWDGDVRDRFPAAYDGLFEAWLLPVSVLALIGSAIVLARAVRHVDQLAGRLAAPVLVLALMAAATIGTVASYPVPVWLVVVLMLLVALGFTGRALARQDTSSVAFGAGFLAGALAVSLLDEWLTAMALAVAVGLSALVQQRWRQAVVRVAAAVVLPLALSASVWTWGAIAGLPGTWTALAVLVLMSGLVLAVPAVGGGVAISMLVFAVAGLDAAPVSESATWTAVYLTVAGVAASVQSLLREEQRMFGWVGGLLLAAASWVRLWDIGVQAPEAYTLPSAVALTVVGMLHLRRHPSASTMTALAPGLGLALVPSLLWVLADPATLRSVLLGAACLLLVVAGVRMRWTAPVLFAATVGALVVLRHAGPFVDQAVPRWVLIATAGTLLMSMGITWERRIQEARAVVGYVRRLR
jgi:hypothetical protein